MKFVWFPVLSLINPYLAAVTFHAFVCDISNKLPTYERTIVLNFLVDDLKTLPLEDVYWCIRRLTDGTQFSSYSSIQVI